MLYSEQMSKKHRLLALKSLFLSVHAMVML